MALARSPGRLATPSRDFLTYDVAVSLGDNCQPAHQLGQLGLRQVAFPFDHVVTEIDALLGLLEHDFAGFIDPACLVSKEDHVLETRYGVKFYHDLTSACDNFDEVSAMYQRRIGRFRRLLLSRRRILFIRKELTRDDATRLERTLRRRSLLRDYHLLALCPTQEPDWGLERVSNLCLRRPASGVWSGDDEAWGEILERFRCSVSTAIDQLGAHRNEDAKRRENEGFTKRM